jgi:hypothetical protein
MRKSLSVFGVGVAVVLMSAAGAWACVSGPTAFVTPGSVRPGGEIKVSGVYFNKETPVQARLDALDGPVLATFTPAKGARSFGLELEGTMVIPATTKPGDHVLVLTQHDSAGKLVQTPSRLLLTVTNTGGATPVVGAPIGLGDTGRPPSLVLTEDDPLSAGAMLLIGLGVAGIGMFVAGVAALAAGRRRPLPDAATVRHEA